MNKIEHGNGLTVINDAGLYGIVKSPEAGSNIWVALEMIWDTTNVCLWLFEEKNISDRGKCESTKVLIMVCA